MSNRCAHDYTIHTTMSAINDIAAKVDLQLYVQAEQGDERARNELKRLANKGWVSSVGWSLLQFAAANGFVEVEVVGGWALHEL